MKVWSLSYLHCNPLPDASHAECFSTTVIHSLCVNVKMLIADVSDLCRSVLPLSFNNKAINM